MPPGWRFSDGEAEGVGERPVLALRVGDGDPAAEDPAAAVDEALGRGRLPGARLAGEEHVRVGDEPRPVGLERVVGEATAAGEDVRPEVGAARRRPGLGQERVGRAEVGGRRPVPGQAQRAEDAVITFHRRARPRPTGRAQTSPRSCRASRARSSRPACPAACSYSAHDRSRASSSAALTVTKPANSSSA